MNKKLKKYRLKKDLIDFQSGEIFTKEENEFGESFYVSEHDDGWGLRRNYLIEQVEGNDAWFQEVGKKPGEEKEKTTIQIKGDKAMFTVEIDKNGKVFACKNCGQEDLVWGKTKNEKFIPVRFSQEKGAWISHFSECDKYND